MSLLSPGLSYILQKVLPSVVGPSFVAYISLHAAATSGLISDYSFLRFSVLTLALVVGKGVVVAQWRRYKQRVTMCQLGAQLIPCPKGRLPGNVDVLRELQEHKYEDVDTGFIALRKLNGPIFRLNIPWNDLAWTDSPYIVKEVLTTQFSNFIKGESNVESFLGTGIFTSNGDVWKFHRAMTRPFFSRDRVTDFDTFDHHAETTIRKIRGRCETGMPVDFQDTISQFTMDSATEFLFGKSVDSLAIPLLLPGGKPDHTLSDTNTARFTTSFQAVLEYVTIRGHRQYPWQLGEIFGDPTVENMKVIHGFLDPIIDAALEKKKEGADVASKVTGDEEGATLLSHLVSEMSDRRAIRDEVLNVLLAGRDTTASNLTFIVYCLSQYPEVLARLRKEIFDVVGPSQRPSFDNIREMKYLRAVINESLRLFPPVPIDGKESVDDTVLTDPRSGARWFFPARTLIVWSVLSMGRSKENWGPDALEFCPDRWLDERNKKYYLANPFIFVPFLAGPRICLGQQFAYNEISFFLIRLLQQFEQIEFAPDGFPEGSLPPPDRKINPDVRHDKIIAKSHITLYPLGGLWVRFK